MPCHRRYLSLSILLLMLCLVIPWHLEWKKIPLKLHHINNNLQNFWCWGHILKQWGDLKLLLPLFSRMGFNGSLCGMFISSWNRWLIFPASFTFNLEASCDVECSNLAAILMSLEVRVKSGQAYAEGKNENNPTRPFVMNLHMYICSIPIVVSS